MTVVEKRAASGIRPSNAAKYLLVGVVAAAIGVGVGFGIDQVGRTEIQTTAQQAMVDRGAAVGEHLDTMWAAGLAQAAAIEEAALLQTRIRTGLVQQQAIESDRETRASSRLWRETMAQRWAAMAENPGTVEAEGGTHGDGPSD